MINQQKYVAPKDVAILLGLPLQSAYNLFHKADFPCVRLGKSLRVDEAKLEEYIQKYTKNNNYI